MKENNNKKSRLTDMWNEVVVTTGERAGLGGGARWGWGRKENRAVCTSETRDGYAVGSTAIYDILLYKIFYIYIFYIIYFMLTTNRAQPMKIFNRYVVHLKLTL